MAHQLQEMFKPLQVPAHSQELISRQMVDDAGSVQEKPTGPMLLWHCRPEAPKRLLLAIHYDTVYPVDQAFQRCRWMGDHRLNGPGVADAKGGIVVLFWALSTAEKYGLLKDMGWSVVLNPDEEIGSPSSWPVWRTLAPAYRYGLLFEPALKDGAVVSQRKGSGMFTVVMKGKAAHAGRHFDEGRNAIAALAELAVEIHGWNRAGSGMTVNVGRFTGGTSVNVVPDTAVLRINVRIEDFSQQADFLSRLQHWVESYNSREGFGCNLTGGFHAPPKLVCPKTAQLMSWLETVSQQQGVPIRFVSTGGVSDGNKLAAVGLPNLDTLGPIGDRLHSPEEWVDTLSLLANSERLLRLLVLMQEQLK